MYPDDHLCSELTPSKGVFWPSTCMKSTPYIKTKMMLPDCASLTNFVQFGLAHFNFDLLLYRRSRRNWCFVDSCVKSGGHVRLHRYGFVSAVKENFGAIAGV